MAQRTKHVRAAESGATDGSGAGAANRPEMAENEGRVGKSSSMGDWDTDGAKSEGSTMSAHRFMPTLPHYGQHDHTNDALARRAHIPVVQERLYEKTPKALRQRIQHAEDEQLCFTCR